MNLLLAWWLNHTQFKKHSNAATMVRSHETQLYRHDVQAKGTLLSPGDRERLIRPYLPPPPQDKAARRQVSRPVHDFVMKQIHILISNIIHVLFTAYIMIRQTHHAIIDRIFAVLYYHHRAPELIKQDVKALDRLPQHLSVILELKGDERGTASLEALMDDVAEISAWCCCVGIPTLSVYEKTGKCPSSMLSTLLSLLRYTQGLCPHHTPSDLQQDACLFRKAYTHRSIAGPPYAIVWERREARER